VHADSVADPECDTDTIRTVGDRLPLVDAVEVEVTVRVELPTVAEAVLDDDTLTVCVMLRAAVDDDDSVEEVDALSTVDGVTDLVVVAESVTHAVRVRETELRVVTEIMAENVGDRESAAGDIDGKVDEVVVLDVDADEVIVGEEDRDLDIAGEAVMLPDDEALLDTDVDAVSVFVARGEFDGDTEPVRVKVIRDVVELVDDSESVEVGVLERVSEPVGLIVLLSLMLRVIVPDDDALLLTDDDAVSVTEILMERETEGDVVIERD
jgi:hypothetical protein